MPYVIVAHFKDGTSSEIEQSRREVPSKCEIVKLQIAGRSISCKVIEVRIIKQPDVPNYVIVEAQEI